MKYYLIYLFLFFPFPPILSAMGNDCAADTSIRQVSIDFYRNDTTDMILPFSRAGNLIVLKGRADTTEGNFILDTGCPGLVLNLTYFRNYQTTGNEVERNGATGAEFRSSIAVVDDFSIGPFHYFKQEAELTNLGNIENVKGLKILGLLGMQLLKNFEMIVDYEKNELQLHRIGKKEVPAYHHPWLKIKDSFKEIPVTIIDNRLMIYSVMGGKKLRLLIDSGAESNLLDSRLPDRIFENVSITGRTYLNGAGNKKLEVLKGDLVSLMIGDQPVEKLPVLITNLERTCFSFGGCVDGILGFDFLSLKRIGFNFVTQKMYIWK